jgi:sulfide:quinone oxidoreductase
MQKTPNLTNSPEGNLKHHQIVIVGGGAAGITVAAQLLAKNHRLDVAIVEPSEKHYYQPAWTLVGAGEYAAEQTIKEEKSCIPSGVTWIKEAVEQLDADRDRVVTQGGLALSYDYLIVCPGIQIDWHLIPGLKEALGKGGVCSNYSLDSACYTWEAIQNFKGGNALFTFPATPIKCAGAPQKIMYLADDAFRRQGVRSQSTVTYCTAGGKIFAIDAYAVPLMEVVKRKGIDLKFQHNLIEIRADKKEAVFEVSSQAGSQQVSLPYDLIHVAPPMSAPDFIKRSKLAVSSALGWVDVDQQTLQHNVYANVFSLGDASSLPTSKTAAAIRHEAPVLVENLLALIEKKPLTGVYNGYTCCPLITGYGKTIMAEFDYTGQPRSSFPFNPTRERYSMWLMKKYGLPWLYWNRMLKGKQFEGEVLRSLTGKQP